MKVFCASFIMTLVCAAAAINQQKALHKVVRGFPIIFGLGFLTPGHITPLPAVAFDNAFKVMKGPKTHGPEPRNIGIDEKGLLRACGKPSPNCFSTTSDDMKLDEDVPDEHAIPLWKFSQITPDEAYKKIGEVLAAYEPGQGNIDGGGFKIIKADPLKRYYYVQYESLRRGFYDDLEIKVDDSSVQGRTSSRMGYLDFAVNAKRFNFITQKLQLMGGFDTQQITASTHPAYFEWNKEVPRT
jgi:uncharacterized protein (DUF1499 family)